MTKKDTKKAAAKPAAKASDKASKKAPAKADAAHMDMPHNALVDHNYLSEEQFGAVAETLQRNLATTICLYLKFKKYHWDIRGRYFRDLHPAYDEFIAMFFDSIDEQAERLVALG